MRSSQGPRGSEARSGDSARDSLATGQGRGRRRRRRLLRVATAVVVTLLVMDLVSSLFYRTDATMSVVRSGPPGESARTLIVFPGYAGDCHSVFDALKPGLDASWALVVLCYADRGIDDDQVFSLLRGDVESAPVGSVSILAGSMGGMVAVTFLDRLARSSTGSPLLAELFLDTVPSDSSFVKRPEFAFRLAHYYRGGMIASLWWRLINSLPAAPDQSALEPTASLDNVERGDRYYRQIGLPTLTSQAQYIDEFRLASIPDFQKAVSSAVFIKAANSEQDPLVDVRGSIGTWLARLPTMRVVEIASRRGDWHIPWTRRPSEVLSVVLQSGSATTQVG